MNKSSENPTQHEYEAISNFVDQKYAENGGVDEYGEVPIGYRGEHAYAEGAAVKGVSRPKTPHYRAAATGKDTYGVLDSAMVVARTINDPDGEVRYTNTLTGHNSNEEVYVDYYHSTRTTPSTYESISTVDRVYNDTQTGELKKYKHSFKDPKAGELITQLAMKRIDRVTKEQK